MGKLKTEINADISRKIPELAAERLTVLNESMIKRLCGGDHM